MNAAAAEGEEEEEDEEERPVEAADVPGALRGGALALARSAAFLARCVAKVCSFTALSAGPVSQAGSLIIVGGEDGAGTGAAVVAMVAVVGWEATLGTDLGMVMNDYLGGVVGMMTCKVASSTGRDDIKKEGVGIYVTKY